MFKRYLEIIFCILFSLVSAKHYGQFQVNNAANQISCDEFQLTPAVNNQSGSAWNLNQINLNNSHLFEFEINTGCNPGGADGIVFGFQPVSTTVGGGGGGIGFSGIVPSLGVEFDTYENGWDPACDHIAVFQNGDLNHNNGNTLAGPVCAFANGAATATCVWHSVVIDWNADTQTLSIYFNGDLRLTYTGDIVNNIFGGDSDVYWGLTAGTGGANNDHRFRFPFSAIIEEYDDLLCNGDSDATATVTPMGGTNPMNYTWSNGQTTQTATGLGAGTHTVNITDGTGCTTSVDITLTEPDAIVLIVNETAISCNGANDGVITIQANGGTPNHQYSIDGGATFQGTGSFTNLAPGSYSILVRDANDCEATGAATITQASQLTINVSSTNIPCYDQNTGSIIITASGGTPAYQFSIDGGTTFQGAGNFTNLAAGTYDILVRDNNDCEATQQITISQPTELTLPSSTFTNASCHGQCNGTISVPAQGGVPPYSWSWQNNIAGASDFQAQNLCAGTYSVTVSDQNNCQITETFTITEPGAITFESASTNVSCYGGNDGSITFSNIQGGNPPYQYSVNNGASFQASPSFTGMTAGNHQLVVRDSNNCTASGTILISQPSELTFTTSPDITICPGTSTVISATPQGGTPPYTFNWSHGLGNANNNVVSPTNNTGYSVSITDANGCETNTQTILVSIFSELSILAIGPTMGVCEGTDVLMSVFVLNGEEPFTYTWSNNVDPNWSSQLGTINYTVNQNTTFTVTVNDHCGSPLTETIEVDVLPLPNPTFVATNPSGCYPLETTFLNTMPPGSTNGVCFWNLGDGNASFNCDSVSHTYNSPGCYDVTLTVESPEGCRGSATYPEIICLSDYPQADFIPTPEKANVMDPKIIFINQTDGGQFYEWDFGGLGTSFEHSPMFNFPSDVARSYQVCLTATNNFGCQDTICKIVEIVEEFSLYLPNAFTPDGDGVNEEFKPIIYGFVPQEFRFVIYNRWGQLIYETVNPEAAWDGKYRGVMVQEGVYAWHLTVKITATAEVRTYKGHVTLLR
jgi:large repetitive protein